MKKNLFIIVSIVILISGCSTIAPPHLFIPKTQPKAVKIKKPIDVALVLGEGGSKGLTHAGAIEALEQAHIPINLIVGTSAGSIIGALYADNPNIASLKSILQKTSAYDVLSDISIASSGSGVIYGYKLQKFLLHYMRAKWFKQLKIPFVAVATDFKSGNVFPINSGPVAPAVNASAAVPGVFKHVFLYGHTLVDGGLSADVPVVIAEKYHPKLIIAINVNSPLPKRIGEGFIDTLQRTYSITLKNLNKAQLAHSQAILINTKTPDGNILKGVNKSLMFKKGYQATIKKIPLIKEKLKELNIKYNNFLKN